MKKTGMIVGIICALLGLGIIFTPMKVYFLFGWLTGIIFVINGFGTLGSALRKKTRSKNGLVRGTIITIVGVILLATDVFQILTTQLLVLLVAGGILVSGLIECLVGYTLYKHEKRGIPTLLLGITSCVVGIGGIINKNITMSVIGMIIGFFVVKIGVSVFMYARDYDKPQVFDSVK